MQFSHILSHPCLDQDIFLPGTSFLKPKPPSLQNRLKTLILYKVLQLYCAHFSPFCRVFCYNFFNVKNHRGTALMWLNSQSIAKSHFCFVLLSFSFFNSPYAVLFLVSSLPPTFFSLRNGCWQIYSVIMWMGLYNWHVKYCLLLPQINIKLLRFVHAAIFKLISYS